MNIFELAKTLESQTEAYYRKQSEEQYSDGVKGIFSMLADEEAKHLQMVIDLEEELLSEGQNGFADGSCLTGALHMTSREHVFGGSVVSVYDFAIEMEKAGVEVYEKLMDEVYDVNRMDLLAFLRNEERRHIELLTNLMDMARKPEEWVEDPEFSHIGEKY